ncbi:MAG: ABC transporter permease [Promethearchaeota archaeon]|nr:MAG: ABC transporter permease [Candidatus Lokiarchaeota archaeon]
MGSRKKNQREKKFDINSIRKSLFRIIRQMKKEFLLLFTDKFNMLLAIVIPPLVILLFGFMMNSAPERINPINCVVISYDSNVYVDESTLNESIRDEYAVPYVDAVNKSAHLNLVHFYNATEEIYAMETARMLLLSSDIKVIISLPVGFSEFITLGLPGLIDCIPDASDIKTIQDTLNAVFDSVKTFVNENNLTPQFELTGFEEFSIPEGYSFRFNYNITLTLSFIVFGVSMVLTILVVVQEKPVARLLLTPAKRTEILLSKYLTYSIILVLQIILLIISTLICRLYLAGSVLDLFMALFIIGFTGLSMGFFISTQSKTKTEANQLFFAVFIVILLLSGIFIPIDAMPIYLQIVAYILPLSHGDPMIRGIITKGKSVFGFDFFALLALSIVLVLISFITFKRRKYEV